MQQFNIRTIVQNYLHKKASKALLVYHANLSGIYGAILIAVTLLCVCLVFCHYDYYYFENLTSCEEYLSANRSKMASLLIVIALFCLLLIPVLVVFLGKLILKQNPLQDYFNAIEQAKNSEQQIIATEQNAQAKYLALENRLNTLISEKKLQDKAIQDLRVNAAQLNRELTSANAEKEAAIMALEAQAIAPEGNVKITSIIGKSEIWLPIGKIKEFIRVKTNDLRQEFVFVNFSNLEYIKMVTPTMLNMNSTIKANNLGNATMIRLSDLEGDPKLKITNYKGLKAHYYILAEEFKPPFLESYTFALAAKNSEQTALKSV